MLGATRASMMVGIVAASPARADDARLEAGPAWDTNVARIQGDETREDGLLRLVGELSGRRSPAAGTSLSTHAHVGGKLYSVERGEDAFVGRVDAAGRVVAIAPLTLRWDAQVRMRQTRAPEIPADFTRAGTGPAVEAQLAGTRLEVRGLVDRFLFEPDAELDATGLTAAANVSHALGPWTVGLQGQWTRRQYDGPRRVRVGGDSGVPIVEIDAGTRRRDLGWRAALVGRYGGLAIIDAEATVERNDSNGHGSSWDRLGAEVRGTLGLSARWTASASAQYTRVVFDDPQYVSREQFLEDEGRSSVSARVERALGESLSLVGHGGWWFSPEAGDQAFSRALAGVSVAWRSEE